MDSSAEPDARSDDTTPPPFEKPAGNWPGKTTTTVNLGNLLVPAPALVVDLDPASSLDFGKLDRAGSLDFGKVDREAMRRAVDRATTGYDPILVDTPPPPAPIDPEQWKIVPDGKA